MHTLPDHLLTLERLQRAFAAALAEADPDAAIPACPGWMVRDLGDHLAETHHWAAAMARHTEQGPVPEAADPVSRYEVCAAELLATLRSLPPEQPAFTLTGEGPASFWHRRQVHETLVHLADLRSAGGDLAWLSERGLDDADDAVWADTIAEVVEVMYPRQVMLGRISAVAAVTVTAADLDRSWVVGDDEPIGAVTASARTLALLLWRRASLDGVGIVVEGDLAGVRRTLATAITP